MTGPVPDSWHAEEAEEAGAPRALGLEDQLALLDRVRGLEARLAEYSAGGRAPSNVLSAEQEVVRMQSSLAWRLGNAITRPSRIVGRLRRRR
ncbi:MAG: hypothetical protein JWN80_2836 [Microbacteriaceae bacterium]|jgi:hypothetical protein|nr:hypothetical protein [Microbacteriaceae bacterium]